MDTHSTTTPSTHLSSVQELLEKLDEMKTGRVAARQRLDFLLHHGSEVIQDFDFRDAFNLEMRTKCDRLKKVQDMSRSLRAFKTSWSDGPLEEDVKNAGIRLVDHLDEFVVQAERKETSTEIEMLSQLWISNPDVNAVFGLPLAHYTKAGTEYGGDTKKYAAARGDHHKSEKVVALEKARDALEEEVASENLKELDLPSVEEQVKEMKKLWPEVPEEEFDRLESQEKKAEELHKAFIDGVEAGTRMAESEEDSEALESVAEMAALARQKELASRIKNDPVFRARLAGGLASSSDDQQVVGQVSRISSSPAPTSPAHQEELPDEVDELDIRSWTLAINETLASKWKFDRQLRGRIGDRGRMGLTLIWVKGKSELRLDLESLALDETLVRLVPPRATDRWSLEEEKKMYQVHAQEMSSSALEELHKDPSDFVKLILV